MVVKNNVEERIINEDNINISAKTTRTYHKKKHAIAQKKLKNSFLPVHTCTIYGTSIKNKESKVDMPYIPSMKSLPCTSYSDATLLLNLRNKKIRKPVQKCGKRNMKQILNKKKRKESSERSHFVENYNKCEGNGNTAVTSLDFISGDYTEYRSDMNTFSTKISNDLKEVDSEILETEISTCLFNTYETKTSIIQTTQDKSNDDLFHNKLISGVNNVKIKPSANKGYLKISGFNAKNETGDVINDKKEITLTSKFLHEYPNRNDNKEILLLFDCYKYPMTDSQGSILRNAAGKRVLKYINKKPYDLLGRLVFDSKGNHSSSPNFQPYSKVPPPKNRISAIPLYDFRGYCLTDYDGSSLTNSDGKDLIQINKEGKILFDTNNNPIFDQKGIPVTKQNCQWFLPRGIPLRVFNENKYPLTNKYGESLKNIQNRELLKCDQHGRPLRDYNDKYVYDTSGIPSSAHNFNLAVRHTSSDIILIGILENNPAELFDKEGWPLTDKNGEIMNDSSGKCLIMLKALPNEIEDYEQYNLILNEPKSLTEICISLTGKIITLDEQKNVHDNLKEQRMVVAFDFVGHPLSDRFNRDVFDKNGRKICVNIEGNMKKNITLTAECSSYESVRTRTTNPLSSKYMQGKYTHVSHSENESANISFQAETDLFGRPLSNSSNLSLFDKYGRPIYDLFNRPIYDPSGRPIASANGKRLDNGMDELPGMDIGFNVDSLIPHDPYNLPEHTDLYGGPLFDSSGFPLYNQKGKPLIDAYGRSLYDEMGIPQCDEKGRPVSKIIKQKQTPIVSVEDTLVRLLLSPYNPNQNKSCFRDRAMSSQESIHDNLLAVEAEENEDFAAQVMEKNFIARVRITSFSDGENCYEILESVPESQVCNK